MAREGSSTARGRGFFRARFQNDPGLTVSGDLLGTLRYMSPEQALAKKVTVGQRSDVYSLGVTWYELLTLRSAFGGRDRAEILRRIAHEEPAPPRRLNPSVPGDLETVVLKCMAKGPEDRYPTARELADDLSRVRDVAFSPDGTRIASVSSDESVRVWRAKPAPPFRRDPVGPLRP